jgi:hypothetical protein
LWRKNIIPNGWLAARLANWLALIFPSHQQIAQPHIPIFPPPEIVILTYYYVLWYFWRGLMGNNDMIIISIHDIHGYNPN